VAISHCAQCAFCLYCRFSDATFHGKDECLELSPEVLEKMIATSKEMLTTNE
jgi:hypothetical protein